MRISDWSSDVCSSDLLAQHRAGAEQTARAIEEELPRGGAGGEDRRDDLEQVAIDRAQRDAVAREPRRRRDDARHRQAGEILMNGEEPGDRPRHRDGADADVELRSEEHTSELQSLMRISYAVFCLK